MRHSVAVVVAVIGLLLAASPANAAFGIAGFDGGVLDAEGGVASQAGSHPFTASTTIDFNQGEPHPTGMPVPAGDVGRIEVALPPGLIGNPTVAAQCTAANLMTPDIGCPRDSQVGVVDVVSGAFSPHEPLYRMVAPPGIPAAFGFEFAGVPVFLYARLRSESDYGLNIEVPHVPVAIPVVSTTVTMWGTPADAAHDAERGGPSTAQKRAFITNPTACTPEGQGLETKLFVRSWEGATDQASFFSHDVAPNEDRQVGPTGCANVPFEPSFAASVDTQAPDSPTGMVVDIGFPQESLTDPSALATAHMKRARVLLPEGMTINPSSADGLAACSDSQLGLGTTDPLRCPEESKIGSVVATTPLLENPVEGALYIRSQASDDPASGELFRLALRLLDSSRGVDIRLPGQVRVDPATGRVEAIFDNNPQLPVSRLQVKLKSGPRAPLATPTDCGTHSIVAELSSWARPDETVTRSDSFTIPCPAGGGFAPGFDAGTISPTGGGFSPFTARIDRPAGQQFLSGVQVDLPKGLMAKSKGVPLCGSTAAESGGCPAGSRIGAATVAAGSGSNPFRLSGDVYLTEGYRGGPYGLAVHVHAKAGPFDLGWVRVRQALYVDPVTAEISVASDPLPQIVKGVPVRLRSVDVDVDRPGFMMNPTSCAEKQVGATLTSADGAVHKTSRRFQAGDCQALAFTPRMAMRLTGRKQTRTGGHPALRAVLTQGEGQANVGSAKVTLPSSVVLDPNNSADPKLLCGYDEALEANCPASSIIGRAVASTPVLDKPLAGNVHLVQGIKFGAKGNRIRTYPTLLVKLRGEVAIDLSAKTSVDGDDRLVTTFPAVPDAPVSKFAIEINGGKKGILVVTRTRQGKINLCNGRQIADVETDGQNGKRADFATRVKTPCAKQAAQARRGKSRRARK